MFVGSLLRHLQILDHIRLTRYTLNIIVHFIENYLVEPTKIVIKYSGFIFKDS